ncbi:ester cyclase [Rugamonas sp. FT107W]|uniref:Ester cyclase n=1 Tax=Duganella vulcania TaxID=2692166 RepID=A0A845HHA0_9BURK|nr:MULTISPECIES: ester cyclase [Duganella]MYN16324.1 ester cyclase [Duganella vulcania]NVD69018.1 ester cyclase [Duganella sp. BJB1802]
MTMQDNGLTTAQQQAIETLYRAFNERNPDLLDQALTPDWQDTPLGPGQQPGLAGMKPVVAMFGAAFPDVHIAILDIFGRDGRAAVRARITGTHRGEFFGIAPTNQPIAIAIHEFHYLGADRITHTWHLEDWFGMLNQIGAWPPVQ